MTADSGSSSDEIFLRWPEVRGASAFGRYTVERWNKVSCVFDVVGRTDANEYHDRGLIAGTTYTYQVRVAWRDGTTSRPSPATSCTTASRRQPTLGSQSSADVQPALEAAAENRVSLIRGIAGALAVASAQAADLVTTVIGLGLGAVEVNPFMRAAYETGGDQRMFYVKLVSTPILVAMSWRRRFLPWVWSVLFYVVAWSNVGVIQDLAAAKAGGLGAFSPDTIVAAASVTIFEFFSSVGYEAAFQWGGSIALSTYGLTALDEHADEHPFRLLAGPIGLLWLVELSGLL